MNTERSRKILDLLIEEYLASPKAISSAMLREAMGPSQALSSATIRNYLRYLKEIGMVLKPHASSGHYPSQSALRAHFKEGFRTLCEIDLKEIDAKNLSEQKQGKGAKENKEIRRVKKNDIEANTTLVDALASIARMCEGGALQSGRLEALCNELGLSLAYRRMDANTLLGVEQRDGGIFLRFAHGGVLLQGDEALLRLCSEFCGLSLGELVKLARDINASALHSELLRYSPASRLYGLLALAPLLGHRELFFELLDGSIFDAYKPGVHFSLALPRDSMLVRIDIEDEDRVHGLLLYGSLERDYMASIKEIAKLAA